LTKLLITCLGENTPEFHFRIVTLFKTIKHFGGDLANAKLVAIFVDEVDTVIHKELKKMGVQVQVTKPYSKHLQRHCNKIRMLELEEDYDILVALDCDTVVTRDFSSEISINTLRRCNSLLDPLQLEDWQYLYNYYNLTIPTDESKIHANSAVLFIPKKYVKRLRTSWLHYSNLITKDFFSLQNKPPISQHKYYTDQFALSLALADHKINFDLLPAEFNIHINGTYQSWAHHLHPYILSYHHNVTADWKLQTTGMPVPDQYIYIVNGMLAK
jgi:hypothetical protein